MICLLDEQRGTKPASVYARWVAVGSRGAITDRGARELPWGCWEGFRSGPGWGFKATREHANLSLCTPRIKRFPV